jgi:hypothetical protein
MKKNLDPKSPEFRDLLASLTTTNRINLPVVPPIPPIPPIPVKNEEGVSALKSISKLPPISKINLPPISTLAKNPLPPLAKNPPPPLAKNPLPPISTLPKIELPPLAKNPLPPLAKNPLPPLAKNPLPPISTLPKIELAKNPLPPIALTKPVVTNKTSPKLSKTSPKLSKKTSPKLTKKKETSKQMLRKRDPSPVSFVDNFAATIELEDLLNMMREIRTRELRTFGENGLLMNDIVNIGNAIFAEKAMYEKAAERNTELGMPVKVYIEMLENWKREIHDLSQKQKSLGRRCNNKEDPISFTPISEIPDGHYIRLESGECWEVESLLDYIQNYTNGKNDASKLKNYRGNLIWQNNLELNRILQHPISVKTGFSAWFNNKNHGDAAKNISEKSLNMMIWAASLLSSRGNKFVEALEQNLNQKQLDAFRKANRNISKIANREIAKEVEFTMKTTLKSLAVSEFYNYYVTLSAAEKAAINTFDRNFEKTLFDCKNGHYCVFGFSDLLVSTHNTIAQVKKLPIVDLGNRFD